MAFGAAGGGDAGEFGALHLRGPKAYPKFIEHLASAPGGAKIKQHDSIFEDDIASPEDCAVAVRLRCCRQKFRPACRRTMSWNPSLIVAMSRWSSRRAVRFHLGGR